jgi:serine/threonine protein phosphatase PrpC
METEYGAASNVGKVRAGKANEDNRGYNKTSQEEIFVVCDGMGGHAGGATASKIAVDSIVDYISRKKYSDAKQVLSEALSFANIQILGTAKENPELKGMGTTACVLLIKDNEAYIAHCGDSRIYLYVAKKKRLYRLTKDHSLVQSLVESGELDDREAENHPRKNVILKGLGIKEDMEPEVASKPVLPAKGDVFLICSDGLSGMIDDNIIESILKQKNSLQDKVNNLINGALDGGGKDNVTVQLIEIKESPYKKSVFVSKNPKWREPKRSKILLTAAAAAILLLISVGTIYYTQYPKLQKIQEKAEKGITTTETDSLTREKDTDVPISSDTTAISFETTDTVRDANRQTKQNAQKDTTKIQ